MSGKPLCLLALDGGGIRGLSELLILEEIMKRVKHDLKMDDDPRPADFFDLIGGTSTGGLIALLLGRLRLSVPEAREEYVKIAKEVFSIESFLSKMGKSKFDGRKLEGAVKSILRDRLGDSRGEERLLDLSDPSCKTFVCAVPQQNVGARGGPRLFRTYGVRSNASFDCTIWEASRATSAAPVYFDPISIGPKGEQEKFVDAGLGYNNPIDQVLEETYRIFPRRKIACIVSIGTGLADVITFPDSPWRSVRRVIKALKNMATESDTTAEGVQRRFPEMKDAYFRFNVDCGLTGIKLNEWTHIPNVRTYTTGYLEQYDVSSQIDKVVLALLSSKERPRQNDSVALIPGPSSFSTETSDLPGQTRMPTRKTPGSIPNEVEPLETVIIPPPPSEAPVQKWVVPLSRNEDFVGRDQILQQVFERVRPRQGKGTCKSTAIKGLGGIGKTQIALEVAFRIYEQQRACHVFWNALSQCASDWLLVIDNADDTNLFFDQTTPLCEYLPSSCKGSILFTTRNNEAAARLNIRPGDVIEVNEMTTEEAAKLLETGLDHTLRNDSVSTSRLLDFLAYMPLAIRQASAYMQRKSITTRDYLSVCLSSDEHFVTLLSKGFEDQGSYKGAGKPIVTTWLISFEHIAQNEPLAVQYLQFMSFLAEKDIPKGVLPPGENELNMSKAIGALKGYAFISEGSDQESYHMHRLVRLVTRYWLAEKGGRTRCVTMVMQQLAEVIPYPKHENRILWMKYRPHMLAALNSQNHGTDDVARWTLLDKLGKNSSLLGKYKEAENLHQQSLQLRTKVIGAEAPDTLNNMDRVAGSLFKQSKYKEAEGLFRQTLRLRAKVLGPEALDTLWSLQGVATSVYKQGKNKEAEGLHGQVLRLQTKMLGPEAPLTLLSMKNLANSLRRQKKFKEAEDLYQKTLRLQIKVLGPEAPGTLSTMHSLAILIDDQGRRDEAQSLFQQTLELRTKVLGPEAPDTLSTMHKLAILFHDQGRRDEARSLFRQTLELRTKVLGPEAPSTIRTRNRLERLLSDDGENKSLGHSSHDDGRVMT